MTEQKMAANARTKEKGKKEVGCMFLWEAGPERTGAGAPGWGGERIIVKGEKKGCGLLHLTGEEILFFFRVFGPQERIPENDRGGGGHHLVQSKESGGGEVGGNGWWCKERQESGRI